MGQLRSGKQVTYGLASLLPAQIPYDKYILFGTTNFYLYPDRSKITNLECLE
jgi:hypothetical protein